MTSVDDTVRSAQQFFENGDRHQALALLHAALLEHPTHAIANNLAGYIELKNGRPEEAEKRFLVAAAAEPDNPAYRENLALARNIREQQVQPSRLRASLASAPAQAEVWIKLAQCEAASERIDRAVSSLYEGLSHCPENPDLLHALGNYLHYAGQLPQAATHYLHCVRVNPKHVNAWIDLSMVYLRLLNAELAESYARAAVSCAPDSVRAATHLASVLHQRNRFGEAQEHLERAKKVAPKDARLYNQLGMTHAALGDIDFALDCYPPQY